MFKRNVFLLCLLALLGAATTVPASAEVNFSIGINVAPPAPLYEPVPPPRVGFFWAPGYWRWDGYRHVWTGGRWIESRPGYHFVGEHWEHRDGRHQFVPGRWEHESGHRFAEHGYPHDYRR